MNEKNRRKYPILLAAAVLIPVTVYGYITETVQKKEKNYIQWFSIRMQKMSGQC